MKRCTSHVARDGLHIARSTSHIARGNYNTQMVSAPASSSAPVDLTMVVPTYNERERIEELVRAVFAACDQHDVALEMIVVDDNSPDGTGAVADGLAKSFRVRVIHRTGKLGLGTAVVAGFEAASARIVGVMDADFSHPPALVPRLLAALHATQADVVIASRYVAGGSTPNWPVWRRLLSRTACLAARPLSPVRDAASGFFLIRQSVASRVAIRAGGFKICLELLMRGWPERLVEVPYRFDDREQGESKMSLREAAGYLTQLRALYALRLGHAIRTSGARRPRRQVPATGPGRGRDNAARRDVRCAPDAVGRTSQNPALTGSASSNEHVSVHRSCSLLVVLRRCPAPGTQRPAPSAQRRPPRSRQPRRSRRAHAGVGDARRGPRRQGRGARKRDPGGLPAQCRGAVAGGRGQHRAGRRARGSRAGTSTGSATARSKSHPSCGGLLLPCCRKSHATATWTPRASRRCERWRMTAIAMRYQR